MSSDISKRKAAIRTRLRARSQRMTPAKRAAFSAQICTLLERQPIWQEARTVLFYLPTEAEPDLTPLLTKALAGDKWVALPHFLIEQNHYEACLIKDLKRDVVIGQFGIREPNDQCPIVAPNQLDLTLVPGVGFDLSGCRLGRGKGYYDRLLAAVPGHKCGVAFEWQVVKEIPWEPHDIRLNSILTPASWHIVVS